MARLSEELAGASASSPGTSLATLVFFSLCIALVVWWQRRSAASSAGHARALPLWLQPALRLVRRFVSRLPSAVGASLGLQRSESSSDLYADEVLQPGPGGLKQRRLGSENAVHAANATQQLSQPDVLAPWELELPPVRTSPTSATPAPRAASLLPSWISRAASGETQQLLSRATSTPLPAAVLQAAARTEVVYGGGGRSTSSTGEAEEREHAWERHAAGSPGHARTSLELSPRPLTPGSARDPACLFPGERPGRPRACVTDPADAAFILHSLPPLLRAETWRLLYATSRDGVSLSSLLRASGGTAGPSLLLIRDAGGALFGAFTAEPWCPHAAHRSFGTGESFVFSCASQPRAVWRWNRGGARVFQTATHEALSLGGAPHFALWLDAELRNGTSGRCSTFDSPCLASSPEFTVAQLEVWHFGADGARVADARDAAAAAAAAARAAEAGASATPH